jgi:hypothetical protein
MSRDARLARATCAAAESIMQAQPTCVDNRRTAGKALETIQIDRRPWPWNGHISGTPRPLATRLQEASGGGVARRYAGRDLLVVAFSRSFSPSAEVP